MKELFKQTFNADLDLVANAPGRLEILGNHTDYNEGFVLSTAVDKKTSIGFRKIDGDVCEIFSPFFAAQGVRKIELNDLATPLEGKDWLNYVRGVLNEMQKRDLKPGAFQAYITSDIPLSAGMSSSASLEMAIVEGITALFDIQLEAGDKAKIGQACENNYIGANTGLMDQLTSLCGQKDQLVVSEYRNLEVHNLVFPSELAWVVINSEVKHDLSEEYNERREQCEGALAKLQETIEGATALRDITVAQLEKNKAHLTEGQYKRALHVTSEIQRVFTAHDLLIKGNFEAFGQLLFDSHQSSINNFENSCPELDHLVELAKESPLCLGARLSGGGFGGVSIHLVRRQDTDAYRQYIADQFTAQGKSEPPMWVCEVSRGSHITR